MSGGMMNSKDPMDLGRVAMPLVRLMRDGGLSWAQKEEIASLIRDLCREHSDWLKEKQHLNLASQMQRAQAAASGSIDISGLGGKVAL